jgi:hypothetical protein
LVVGSKFLVRVEKNKALKSVLLTRALDKVLGRLIYRSWGEPPVFFVSVASKGVSPLISPLKSTLARIFVSVASKGFRG